VIGAPEIGTSDVKTALTRVDDMEADNHEAVQFHRADTLNSEFDGKPPHKKGTIVIDFEMNGDKTLYRLADKDDNLGGEWLFEKDVLKKANTKSELINELSLLPKQWNKEYNQVVKLDTSKARNDAKLRVSTTGKMESDVSDEIREGGAKQYKIELPEDEYVSNGWSIDGDISKYVETE